MDNGQSLMLPVLPIKNAVLFPHLLMPLSIGRAASVAAVEAAVAHDKRFLVVTQRDPTVDKPGPQDLYVFGTVAVIKQLVRHDDGSLGLVALGTERAQIRELKAANGYALTEVQPSALPEDSGAEVEALHRAVLELAGKMLSLAQPKAAPELAQFLSLQNDPLHLVYFLGSMLSLETAKAQALLEAPTRREALRLMHSYLSHDFGATQN